jgi:hypothetical protein
MNNKQKLSDEGRALLARKLLWELIASAKPQVDPVRWRLLGGIELEDFADALETGRAHPLLERWQQQKSVNANRPAPGFRELTMRRYVVLMCAALERGVGFGRDMARKRACHALQKLDRDLRISPDAIARWQREAPALGPEDDKIIANALAHGRKAADITHYFIGLCRFYRDPVLGDVRFE